MAAILEEPPPPAALGDRELLDQAVAWQVQRNRSHAAWLEHVHAFHSRRVAEHEAGPRDRVAYPFPLTPLAETRAELGPLLGESDLSLQIAIETTASIQAWLPRLWARFRAGRLDLGRVAACLDQLPRLADDEARAAYCSAIQDWFDKHDPPDASHPLCPLPRSKVQRAARYQRLKLPQADPAETFAEAFAKRRVSLRVDEESGMAGLHTTLSAPDALRAHYRLTLIAEHRAEALDETRTLAQLRADTLLDLIEGRIVAPSTSADLQHRSTADCSPDCPGRRAAPGTATGADGDARDPLCSLHPLVLTTDDGGPIGGYARAVVNVTVPITTLMGLEDHPGLQSGGIPIPGDLARHIALDPEATWYRMLTDSAGEFVELSTHSYRPTEPMARYETARDQTCVWPTCTRPAVLCHLDHRTPYPEGATSVRNQQPLCRRHHHLKHTPGYALERDDDGSYTWTTRWGSTFTTPPSEQPTPPRPAERLQQADVDLVFGQLVSPLELQLSGLVQGQGRPDAGVDRTRSRP